LAEKTEQFNSEGPPEFSDELIRRFLLGRLSAEGQSRFADRLFAAEDLEWRVRLAELELADDYAFERLSAQERLLFEQKFLVSADRKQKVSVSRALRNHFAPPAIAKTTERQRLSPFGFNQPVWRFAFGVAALLLLIGTVWLVVREPRIKQRILARHPAAPAKTRESAHPKDASPAPIHETTAPPGPDHEPTALPLPIASLVLSPNGSREGDNLPRVKLSESDRGIVRLQLTLTNKQSGTYRAQLLTIAGQSVFSAQSLGPADTSPARIDFDVPPGMLKAGDYEVKLSRVTEGSKESEARYYFRVE